jgi:hypothetical protein
MKDKLRDSFSYIEKNFKEFEKVDINGKKVYHYGETNEEGKQVGVGNEYTGMVFLKHGDQILLPVKLGHQCKQFYTFDSKNPEDMQTLKDLVEKLTLGEQMNYQEIKDRKSLLVLKSEQDVDYYIGNPKDCKEKVIFTEPFIARKPINFRDFRVIAGSCKINRTDENGITTQTIRGSSGDSIITPTNVPNHTFNGDSIVPQSQPKSWFAKLLDSAKSFFQNTFRTFSNRAVPSGNGDQNLLSTLPINQSQIQRTYQKISDYANETSRMDTQPGGNENDEVSLLFGNDTKGQNKDKSNKSFVKESFVCRY